MRSYSPETEDHVVQIVGLGFVGLTLAAVLARKQKVLGVEVNDLIRESVDSGIPHFHELGLNQLVKLGVDSGNLTTNASPQRINAGCTYIITVGTPVSSGSINLEALIRTSREVAKVAKDDDLVIVRSTVSVGSSRSIVQAALDGAGKTTMLAMCPERTMEGKAIVELTELPQIVGGRDQESTSAACKFFSFHGVKTVEVSDLEAAEMTKLVNNTYRDLQFAFGNEIAALCDRLGINAREVISAANQDYDRSNISFPGLTAGPCLEKDPWILHDAGDKAGIRMQITRSAREVNERAVSSGFEYLKEKKPALSPKRVLVAGLAFKGRPETSDTRGSLAFEVIRQCKEIFPNAHLTTFDPLVKTTDLEAYLAESHLSELSLDIEPFDFIVVQHNGESMLNELSEHRSLIEQATILDFWDSGTILGLFPQESYISIGGRIN
jgi:UDP-N-acetyl-D-mannosaminuronic acid dehydrogenase